MPKELKGRFQAQDAFDLAGNHIWNWKHLNDIFHENAETGYVLATIDGLVTWTNVDFGELAIGSTLTLSTLIITGSTSGISYNDLSNVPAQFTPTSHTHLTAEIADLDVVDSLTASNGINVSANRGDITISADLAAGNGINVTQAGTITIAADIAAGNGITVTQAATLSVALNVTAGTGISITEAGTVTIACDVIASEVPLVTTNFDGNLSGSDTTVQAAMETLDDMVATSTNLRLMSINIMLADSATLTTGARAYVRIPADGVIQSYDLVGDISGDLKIDIWSDTYANWPPTNADSICGGVEPEITSALKDTNSSLGSWTTTVTEGDWWIINVDSCNTITHAALSVKILKDTE